MNTLLHNTQHPSSTMFHTTNLPVCAENVTIVRMEKDRIINNIRKIRESMGLTQSEFGKPINASRQDVSRYENGIHLTVRLLLNIYNCYKITPNETLLPLDNIILPIKKIFRSDTDLMDICTDMILNKAKELNKNLDRRQELAYSVRMVRLVEKYRALGKYYEPNEILAESILQQAA